MEFAYSFYRGEFVLFPADKECTPKNILLKGQPAKQVIAYINALSKISVSSKDPTAAMIAMDALCQPEKEKEESETI